MDENHTILWYDDHTIFGMIIHGMIFIPYYGMKFIPLFLLCNALLAVIINHIDPL